MGSDLRLNRSFFLIGPRGGPSILHDASLAFDWLGHFGVHSILPGVQFF